MQKNISQKINFENVFQKKDLRVQKKCSENSNPEMYSRKIISKCNFIHTPFI